MGLFDFFKKKKSIASQQDRDKRELAFSVEIAGKADELVEAISDRYNGLNYSIESLKVIDKMLEDMADYVNEMPKELVEKMIERSGAYIFEVAKRSFGGRYYWYDDLNQPILVTGQPKFEASLLAYEKVRGRLKNGYEDNIPFFFEGYVEVVQAKKSAMIV